VRQNRLASARTRPFKILNRDEIMELAYGKGKVPTLWRETDREEQPGLLASGAVASDAASMTAQRARPS
jgi:hypothetical protein